MITALDEEFLFPTVMICTFFTEVIINQAYRQTENKEKKQLGNRSEFLLEMGEGGQGKREATKER